MCQFWVAGAIEYWKKDMDFEKVQEILKHDNGHGVTDPNHAEPIYRDTYLPRKFKMGVTVPGDNSIDIYTQDIGIVVMTTKTGRLQGFNLMVGGGLGRTHRKENTFPRLADHLGFVEPENIFEVLKAIVAVQRDHGNREVRMNARMKYLIQLWGIDKFRDYVEEYSGVKVSSCGARNECEKFKPKAFPCETERTLFCLSGGYFNRCSHIRNSLLGSMKIGWDGMSRGMETISSASLWRTEESRTRMAST